MPDKHQFTLKWLLVEVALMAVCLAMLRWFIFTNHDDETDLVAQLRFFVGIPIGLACFGAVIGGFFRQFLMGALGALLFLLLFVLVSLPQFQ